MRGHRPQGWLHGLLALPILLYRLHRGWLFGHRFLLLIHMGRKSGLRLGGTSPMVQKHHGSASCGSDPGHTNISSHGTVAAREIVPG
jgi:hypothetical protein